MKQHIISLLLLSGFGINICAQNTITYPSKLSAGTLTAMLRAQKADTPNKLNAFIKLYNDADRTTVATEYGVKFNVGGNGLYTAIINPNTIEALSNDARVERLDIGNNATTTLDRVRPLVNADKTGTENGLPTLFDGKGVIIGVVDNGFDFTHPMFKDADGNCRIITAWDQNVTGGFNDYGYGVIYNTTEKILAARHDNSYDTHGTHVLGIAGGSSSSAYKGIATGAQLAVVSTNKSEQGIIDGVDYLIKYAESQGKPIAINVSLGTVLGYKDGTSNFAQLLDQLLSGKKGVLLSIATGNEGHRNTMIASNNNCSSTLVPPSYGRENIFMQGETGHSYKLKLTLKNTATGDVLLEKILTSDNETSEKITDFGTDDRANALLTMSSLKNAITEAPTFNINLSYLTATNEQWQIEFTTDGGKYMAACDYGSFAAGGNEGFVDGSSASTLASTSTGKNPIAVGAYVSRKDYTDISGKIHNNPWTEGDIYVRSGKGPTFDGRIKPDVVAPGAAVISSLNSFAAMYSVPSTDKVYSETTNDRTYYWGVGSGTSMATPAVTGTMALWLQANSTLTLEQAKQIIGNSAISDTYAKDLPNSVFGYGKIDALAGLKLIITETGINNTKYATTAYDIQNGMLIMDGKHHVTVYSTDGTKLFDTSASTVDLNQLATGFYIVKFGNNAIKYCRK